MSVFRLSAFYLCHIALAASTLLSQSPPGPLPLATGDKIVIIGNTLAERMQMDGHFETLLHARFPEHQLVVRNLGWSADEIDLRPRSANFDDHGHRLVDHKPNVILVMFGFNESFAGDAGIESFRKRFVKFLNETPKEAGSNPVLVICSPIPHENLKRRTLPDGQKNNVNLELYSNVMREESVRAGLRFIDLFHPMKQLMDQAQNPFTINGVHLNADGNAALARVLDRSLFGAESTPDLTRLETLRQAVIEKDRQFYYDYRAVNGYYIYGGRMNPYGVVNFPEEFAKLRKMISLRDERIWKIARGATVPAISDDSSTGTLSAIPSNVVDDPVYHTPEESQALFDVAPGYVVELVASEVEFPDLMNPVAIDIDARGRLWVTTTPTYPQYLPGTPVNDKVLIFEDTNRDGRADKQTIFADGLHLPIGIALADRGAYVSQQPNLMFLKDTNGDDVADQQTTVLHGFDSADSHHSISAFVMGPGGELYFQEGTFHHSQIETPYGPQRVKNAAVFRYEPLTEKLSVFVSYNFANPWGHCFDRWGQNIVADASGGANYFAAAFSGDSIYPHKHRQMNQFLVKQWRPTAGCLRVSSSNFPEADQGNYILNNTIGFLGTLQYKVSDDGSGIKAEPVDPLLSSRDTNFRPIGMKFGPDGALYIVDWFNPLIGHMQHNLRDPKRDKHHGRIWRVRYKDKPLLEIPEVEKASTADVVRLLERYDDSVRELARRELRSRDTAEVEQAIDAWIAKNSGQDEVSEHRRLEGLWVMQNHDRVRIDLLERVLSSRDGRARAAGARVLCYWRDRVANATEWFIKLAADPFARVRLEAVRAASFYENAEEGRKIVNAALSYPLDYYLNYTITETNTTLDQRDGGSTKGASGLVQRLTGGDVSDAQLVQLTQLAVRDAKASDVAKIVNAILVGSFRSETAAAALTEVLNVTKANGIVPPINVEVAVNRYERARSESAVPLLASIANLAGQWEIEGLTNSMRSAILDPATPPLAVESALTAMTKFNTPSSSDFRGEVMRSQLPASLKLRFARAIARVSIGQAAQAIGQAVSRGVKPEEHELLVSAADAVIANKGIEQLTSNLDQITSPDAAKLLLRSVYAGGTTTGPLVEMLSKSAGIGGPQKPLTPDERVALIKQIESTGNAQRGQWIYRRTELNCIQCHVLSGGGGKIGPDLSGVGVTSPTEYLLDSLLEPSKQMKEAYLTLKVLTSDGRVISGVKVDRDDKRLVLRDEKGQEMIIAADEIEEESEGKSLMPEGLHHLLTQDELVDLVAFLGALGKPGEFVVNTRPTIQRYRYLADGNLVDRLAALPEGQLESELAKVDDANWQPVYALVDGKLPKSILGTTPKMVVLRGDIQVVTSGDIGFRIVSSTDVQTVVEGKSVSAASGQTVKMGRGLNSVYFVIEQPEKLESLSIEITKPSGSGAQVTVVGG